MEALAEERGESPGKDRRADPSTVMPPVQPVVQPAEERGAPIPDLSGRSDGDLIDMMDRAYDAHNWELFDAIEAELTRRDGREPADDQGAVQDWLAAEAQWGKRHRVVARRGGPVVRRRRRVVAR